MAIAPVLKTGAGNRLGVRVPHPPSTTELLVKPQWRRILDRGARDLVYDTCKIFLRPVTAHVAKPSGDIGPQCFVPAFTCRIAAEASRKFLHRRRYISVGTGLRQHAVGAIPRLFLSRD